MTSPTRITAVLACYNAVSTISDILDDLAVAADACPSVELNVLVVDDRSTDATVDVLAARTDITVLRQTSNEGVCAARQVGTKAATGDYLWFVDADDRIPKNALESFAAGLIEGPDVVIGRSITAEAGSPPPEQGTRATIVTRRTGTESLTALLRARLRGQLWDKLIRRSLIDDSFFTGTPVHSDVPIAAGALAAASRVVDVDGLVYSYTISSSSIIGSSRNRARSVLKCADSILSHAVASDVDQATIAYFRAWFVGLSLYRDLESSTYAEDEAARISEQARLAVSWSAVSASARFGSRRRTVSLALAAVSGGAFLSARSAVGVRRRPSIVNRRPHANK